MGAITLVGGDVDNSHGHGTVPRMQMVGDAEGVAVVNRRCLDGH